MSIYTETPQISTKALNQAFLRALSSDMTKEAQEESNTLVREIARQASNVREVLGAIGITEDELDQDDRSDNPRKIVEREPSSYASRMEFRGQPHVTWINSGRASVNFFKIASQKSVKEKETLMTYKNDIRQIMAENKTKDVADAEDKYWNELQMAAVQAAPSMSSTNASQFSSSGFKRGFQALLSRRRPIGRMLMTQGLLMEAIDLPASLVGNDVANEHYKNGVENITKLWNYPVTSSIKEDIYDPRAAWIYSPSNYLGRFYTLQDATLFLKQEANIIEFYVYEIIGMAIINRLSVQRVLFEERS